MAKLVGAPEWLVQATEALGKALGLLPEPARDVVTGLQSRLEREWALVPVVGVADEEAARARSLVGLRVMQTPVLVLLRHGTVGGQLPGLADRLELGRMLLPKALLADHAAVDAYVRQLVERVPSVLAGWVQDPVVSMAATRVAAGDSLELLVHVPDKLEATHDLVLETRELGRAARDQVQGVSRFGERLARPLVDAYRAGVAGYAVADPDRTFERAQIAQFAAQDAHRWWWWQAEPWAGKTTLLADLATRVLDGAETVVFLTIGRDDSHNSRAGFLARMLPQLAIAAGDQRSI
jgi:hypothetical protein